MTLPIEMEGLLWKQALKHFGADKLKLLLIEAQGDFYSCHESPRVSNKATKCGTIFTINGKSYWNFKRPLLRKVFGSNILDFIRSTPELRQSDAKSGKLEMPERLRIHLSDALLRQIPLELLDDAQRDQLFASDLGL